jgi:uncharacterized protein YggE
VVSAASRPTVRQYRGMGRSITVTGRGRSTAAYDEATLRLAASARAASPSDATARATYAMAQMRDAVLAGGADAAALTTTNVSLNPVHDPWPTVVAYEASLGLSVRLLDLTRVGSLLVAAVDAGGDGARVDGITFSHHDSVALERAARDAAFADARAKAEQYAGLARQALGEVRHVVEGGADSPVGPRRGVLMASAEAGLPVDSGEGTVVADVSVTWALGPAV